MDYRLIIPTLMIEIVIMGYFLFRPRLPIRMNYIFLALLTIGISLTVIEYTAGWLNENNAAYSPSYLWSANLLAQLFRLSNSYMFFNFTVSYLDSRMLKRSRLSILAPSVFVPCVLILLSTPVTRLVFWIGDGFRGGKLVNMVYFNGIAYVLFSTIAVLRHVRELSLHETVSLLALQMVLLAGNLVRMLLPEFPLNGAFTLTAQIVIFISFVNPDRFLADGRYSFNLAALQTLLEEKRLRRKYCRVLGFAIRNYSEHREIFGGRQMEEALGGINRWLKESFPSMSAFYMRNGAFALVGENRPDLVSMRESVRERFSRTWKIQSGEVRMAVSFVEADTEILDSQADRLINTLMISLDELSRGANPDDSRSLTDSILEINRKLDIRRCLEKALDEDGLEVFLQPLVDSATGKRIAAEALVRLRDEKGNLISPDLFITMAEREGYIFRLGEQVFERVCRFISSYDMEELGVRWINVNLSPVQLISRDIPAVFSQILARYGVSEKLIHLEITEQSIIDAGLLQEQILALHGKGFEFALDDYGSGYSNLSRVRQYPFTNIKIDMSVVRSYCRDRDPMLPALIRAFRQMNLSITAEGIESQEMADSMKDIGCDYLQGYHYSRPVPMSEFVDMD